MTRDVNDMTYIDCYLVPVPHANKVRYEQLARISAEAARECGALRTVECWLDEAGPDGSTYHAESARGPSDTYATFRAAAGAGEDETVVMSWVEWPDKRSRDEGMERLTADPRMQFDGLGHVFDGSRLIAGGFCPMETGNV
ncbi:MAG: DUF1428 domain-containing protein [Coriobacteriia bacterium]|nr:DUF1428 domain-containing protein [Coriobacteriia bacterium]